jgi:hypothetical protein
VQDPSWHASSVVQLSPSLQRVPSGAGSWRQATVASSQESRVQGSASSHAIGVPPVHAPPRHVPPQIQAEEQTAPSGTAAWAQPAAGKHESSVQGLSSSQSDSVPDLQIPDRQAS